jgi:hypothetical protein
MNEHVSDTRQHLLTCGNNVRAEEVEAALAETSTEATRGIEPDAALVYLYLWTTRRLRTIDHAARVAHAVPLDVALWIPRTAGSARRAA